jgi:hypothetical protein
VAPELRASSTPQVKEIARNQMYSEFFILKKKDFENADISFDLSYTDPYKLSSVSVAVTK